MNRTKLTTGSDTTNSTFYQTAAFTPQANNLVLVFIASASTASAAANTPTVTGANLTFEAVHDATTSDTGDFKISCFRSMANAPTAVTLVIDFAGQKQDCCTWSVFEYDGVPTTGSNGSDAVVQTADSRGNGQSLSAPLAAPVVGTSENRTVAALLLDFKRNVRAGSGFTEIDVQDPTGGGQTCVLQTQDSNTPAPAQTSEWTWAGGASAVAIVLEIKAGEADEPATSLDDALAKHFAPILFLHKDERLVPVNAQRYVEQAAMWSTGTPPDDKNGWGRLIPTGGISTEPNASRYLNTTGNGRSCFLELGGWKDKSGNPEVDVDASTSNVYANRDVLESNYQGLDPDMTPWYHAEIMDISAMKAVAGAAGTASPDYGPTIDRIGRNLPNAKMLNYYLYFPDHVQSVIHPGRDCAGNIESIEVSCRAGDWQCISLLLSSDDPGNAAAYTPAYMGLTGLRAGGVTYPDGFTYDRPYAFDGDMQSVMKVARWKPTSGPSSGQPETVDSHPKLFVARDTHSLYAAPTTEEPEPYPRGDGPDQCGRRETPRPIPPDPNDNGLDGDEDLLILLAKLLAGAASGFFPAFCVAYYSVFDENLVPGFGTYIPTGEPSDSTPPDTTPPSSPAEAIIIRPDGVAFDDESAFFTWQSEQAHDHDGRQYDYLVDRDAQIWWPHPDNEHGYYGRWGQQVAADQFNRRSGPHFPNYVRMFLEAFESGLRGPSTPPDFSMGP